MLMPRFSKVEAVVEGSTIKVNVELKINRRMNKNKI